MKHTWIGALGFCTLTSFAGLYACGSESSGDVDTTHSPDTSSTSVEQVPTDAASIPNMGSGGAAGDGMPPGTQTEQSVVESEHDAAPLNAGDAGRDQGSGGAAGQGPRWGGDGGFGGGFDFGQGGFGGGFDFGQGGGGFDFGQGGFGGGFDFGQGGFGDGFDFGQGGFGGGFDFGQGGGGFDFGQGGGGFDFGQGGGGFDFGQGGGDGDGDAGSGGQ